MALPFEYAVAHGFDAFEWFPDKKSGEGWTENDISEELRSQIRNTALACDIQLSVHISWPSNPLNLGLNELPKTIGFAQDIGAALLNIHFCKDAGIAAYCEALAPVMQCLTHAGIKLSIENTPETGPQDFNELFRHLHSTGLTRSGHVGMCLDLGHANLYNETRNDYLKFIDLLDSHVPIIHIHLHENYGDFDSHLPLFTGPAGKDPSGIKRFIERMGKRGFSGCMILEQWPQPESLLNEARQRLLEIISITENIQREPGLQPHPR